MNNDKHDIVRYFLGIFDIIGRLDNDFVIIDEGCFTTFERLCAALLLRYNASDMNGRQVGKKNVYFRTIHFSDLELFIKIATFWVRSFGGCKYSAPTSDELLQFRKRCHDLGCRTTFGKNFADGYKAYCATLANWTFVNPFAIRAHLINQVNANPLQTAVAPVTHKVDEEVTTDPSVVTIISGEAPVRAEQ